MNCIVDLEPHIKLAEAEVLEAESRVSRAVIFLNQKKEVVVFLKSMLPQGGSDVGTKPEER